LHNHAQLAAKHAATQSFSGDSVDIRQFLEVSATVASSGQPSRKQFTQIAESGYAVVINLALKTSDNALADEGEVVTKAGMQYIHIPVVWEQPELQQFTTFVEVMRANRGQRIWVHCALNMRVSVFLYLYHVLAEDWEEPRAKALLNRIWEPNETWQAFIRTVKSHFEAGG
jgi:protein tyrosine phosphatase (PTP) superfamily phosphohydrolase (DUF442 family)